MAPEEQALTPKEARELLITVRHNQATMSTLSEQIKDIHRVVIGNGKFKESIVGRLQIVEERQKVGAKQQDEISDDITEIRKCLNKHTALLERDHTRISDNAADIAEMKEDREEDRKLIDILKETIAAARNKAVGIGIGVGLGTGTGLFGISKIIEAITSSGP